MKDLSNITDIAIAALKKHAREELDKDHNMNNKRS